jgi:hypothetical protein
MHRAYSRRTIRAGGQKDMGLICKKESEKKKKKKKKKK